MCPKYYLLLTLVAFIFCGCSQQAEPPADAEVPEAGEAVQEGDIELGDPTEAEPVPAGQSEESTSEPEGSAVTLEIKSWEEIQQVIADSKGKITIVDLWATYCGPCLVELPNLVKLHNEHGDKLNCISVSLDYQGFEDQPPQSYVDAVQAVLKQKGATFQNFLCSTDSETIYNEKLEQGSIPVVYVYNAEGELAAQFPDPANPAEFTYQEDIVPVVMKLLESK